MKALVLTVGLAGLVGLGFFACNPNSIGRPCVNPSGSLPLGTQISSPALECPSRLCLIEPASISTGNIGSSVDGGSTNTCTAFCSSNDDCAPETTSQCKAGFACAVATTVGDFCCRKICICKADLQTGFNVADGGVQTPYACDPKVNSLVTCKNVKGATP